MAGVVAVGRRKTRGEAKLERGLEFSWAQPGQTGWLVPQPCLDKICCSYPLLVPHSENPWGPGCTPPSCPFPLSSREDFEGGDLASNYSLNSTLMGEVHWVPLLAQIGTKSHSPEATWLGDCCLVGTCLLPLAPSCDLFS